MAEKVVGISCTSSSEHESAAHREITRMIARWLACPCEEKPAPIGQPVRPGYYVPDQTMSASHATAWGIKGEHDLFGGVVPFPFVATKAITHPLAENARQVPHGWSSDMAEAVKEVVPEGYTAFDDTSAYHAGLMLLRGGAVRVKSCADRGGTGQIVARSRDELKWAVDRSSHDQGTVLERELTSPVTFSVGTARIGERVISYWGTQSLTESNVGRRVYGGSRLHVVLGPLAALLEQDLEPAVQLAIEQTIVYENAALRCYRGLFASRRNYDVIQGLDSSGRLQSGVLEQSWRIGGATAAEILAFQVLEAAPNLQCTVETVERYGQGHELPSSAHLVYAGDAPDDGEMIKYAQVIT